MKSIYNDTDGNRKKKLYAESVITRGCKNDMETPKQVCLWSQIELAGLSFLSRKVEKAPEIKFRLISKQQNLFRSDTNFYFSSLDKKNIWVIKFN